MQYYYVNYLYVLTVTKMMTGPWKTWNLCSWNL